MKDPVANIGLLENVLFLFDLYAAWLTLFFVPKFSKLYQLLNVSRLDSFCVYWAGKSLRSLQVAMGIQTLWPLNQIIWIVPFKLECEQRKKGTFWSNLVNCDLCQHIVKSIPALIGHVIEYTCLSLLVQIAIQRSDFLSYCLLVDWSEGWHSKEEQDTYSVWWKAAQQTSIAQY